MTSFLGGGGRVNNTTPVPTGLRVSSSVAGKPRPIVYGQFRISYTTGWATNFQQQGGNSGGGGKGGGGGGGGKGGNGGSQYYTVDAIQLLCEGPIASVITIYDQNGDQSPPPGDNLIPDRTFYLGTYSQNPDALTTSDLGGAQALAYRGTAYAIGKAMNIGDSPTLGNDTFEIKGAINSTVSGFPDACPSLVLVDYLTNQYYSLGFPTDLIDPAITDATKTGSMASYCRAAGLLVSTSASEARAANDWLKSLLKAVNCEARWSGGLLTIVPYGDAALSANGCTYTPVISPLYSLGDDDFVAKPGEAPVKVTIKDQSQTINDIRVEYLDRGNSYNPEIAEAWDDALIQTFGRRSSDAGGDHFFCLASAAQMSAQLQLGREQIVTSYEFTLGARHILLDVLDIVALNDAALGLVDTTVRITEIEEQDDGTLKFTAEDYLVGSGNAPVYGIIPKAGTQPIFNLAAPPINTPVIFEPQASLTGGDAEVWVGLSGTYGQVDIWISVDGDSYVKIGSTTNQCRMGVLTGSLAAFSGSNPDSTDTLGVNLTESGGTLSSGTSADAAAARTLCYVDGELLSYETATLTSANEYNLTTLYRGLYGTSPAAHASGAQFLRLDDNVFKYPLPASYVGQTLSFKFQTQNVYGGGLQDLSTCAVYTYGANGEGYLTPAPAGAISVQAAIPSTPTGLTATGGQNVIVLSWNANPEAYVLGYRVWSTEGDDADFADAAVVAYVYATTWAHTNLGYGETRTYFLEALSSAGSSSPEGPVYATTAFTLPIQAIGRNAISTDQLIPLLQQSIANIESVAQGAVVAAAQATSAQAYLAIERNVRATADQSLAQQITTLGASFEGSIATVQGNITTVATAQSATASSLDTLTTTVDGQSASIAANTASINGVTARYTVQIELDSAGTQYIGGFGLIGSEDGSGGVAFNATFLVSSFTIAQLIDGVVSPVSPFTVSGGQVVIQEALIGSLSANKITSGTISSANIVIQPTSAGQGLTVYTESGTKFIDSALGIYPGSATPVFTTNTVLSGSSTIEFGGGFNNTYPIAELTESFVGRAATAMLSFDVANESYGDGNTQVNLFVAIDSVPVIGPGPLQGQSGTANAFMFPLTSTMLSGGTHTVLVTAIGGGADSYARPTISNLNFTIMDFKA